MAITFNAKVLVKETGLPLAGATVTALNSVALQNGNGITDSFGNVSFVVDRPSTGSWLVTCTKLDADQCFGIESVTEEVEDGDVFETTFTMSIQVDTEECFNPSSVNDFNFYNWHAMTASSFPLSKSIGSCFCSSASQDCFKANSYSAPFFPSMYKKNLAQYSFTPSNLQAFSGFNVAFQVNFNKDNKNTQTTWQLGIFNDKDLVATAFATIYTVTNDDGDVNLYTRFAMPDLPTGVYYFGLFVTDYTATNLRFISNPIEVLPADKFNQSGEIQYRNDRDLYDFLYTGTSNTDFPVEDFKTIARIPLSVIATEYRDEQEIYKEVSTGIHRAYKQETDRLFTVETWFLDEARHEGFATAIKHEDFQINNIQLQMAGSYTKETIASYNKSKGNVTMYDQAFARINKGC